MGMFSHDEDPDWSTVCELEADIKQLKAENATLKANSNAVQTYITQNQQLKMHIDGLEKKVATLKAENLRLKEEIDYLEFQKKLHQQKEITLSIEKTEMYNTLRQIQKIAENQDLYRGRQAIATKILKILTKAEEE